MTAKPFASSADVAAKPQTLEVLADGVYALTAEGDPNVGAVEGEDFLVCFEALATPTAASRWLARLRQHTDKPVRYLVLFHYHAVRVLGASAFGAEVVVAHDATRALIALKAEQLDKEVLEVERALLLLTIVHGPRNQPYRYEVSSEFDTWFVIQIFRDTLSSILRSNDASKALTLKRGGFFRKISRGGSAYMAFEDVRQALLRVMPSAVETLREDLNDLKDAAKKEVEELARNESSLDWDEVARTEVVTREGKRVKAEWLTCAKVEEKDIPWRAGGEESG